MAKERQAGISPPEQVISIIGPGMKITGDCETDGAVRVEGTVHGNIRAGKAVVIGKDGLVEGDIQTQDAVISGRVKGSLRAESRLEVQSTSRVEGEISAGRMQLEEGSLLNGTVKIGKGALDVPPPPPPKGPEK
jgi:cytoskeletal protein CcmA (bactofilin family)